MKRSIKMAALLLVLVLMVCGTLLVQKLNETQSVSETEGSFALTAHTAEEVSGLQWTHEETAYHFIRQDGAWQNADDAAFPASTDALDDMAETLVSLNATRKLEDVEDLSAYGLDAPAFTLTAEWADGTSVTYAMGAQTPFADGYYLSLSGETGVVYAVEDALDDLFAKSGTELASLETIPEVADANRLTIGDAFDALMAESSTTINENQLWYAADGSPLEHNQVEALVDDASALAWQELLSTSASEEELTTFGLTEETATAITLSGPEASMTLLIGAANDDGDFYARLPESSMVYTVAADDVSDLLSASAADLRVKDLMPIAYDAVHQAAITAGGQTFTFSGVPEETADEAAGETDEAQQETADEATQETAEETAETDEAQQETAEEENPAEEIWQLIAALEADSFVDETPQGDALLVVSATNAADAAELLSFYEYDAESYLAVTSDGTAALTDAAEVDKIIRMLRQLV